MSENAPITFYEILGVEHSATNEQISAAYQQALQRQQATPGTNEQANSLLERAYTTLVNPESRHGYDEYLASLASDLQSAPSAPAAPATLGANEPVATTAPQPVTPVVGAAPQPLGLSDTPSAPFNPTAGMPPATDPGRVEAQLLRRFKRTSLIELLSGIGLGVAGVVATLISYAMASPGEHFYYFWGLCVWGLAVFIRGLYRLIYPYDSMRKAMAKNGQPQAAFASEKSGRKARAVVVTVLLSIAYCVVLGVGGLIALGMESGSTSSNSSGLSDTSSKLYDQYNACNAQYDTLQKQLDSINAELDQDKANNDVAAFNALVPQQNDVVDKAQAQYDKCEALRTQYNDSLDN